MAAFMDEDFILENDVGKRLFHQYAENLPIIDYHCHLSAKEIYENKPAQNITQLWLYGDHYKWRVMRANAVPEAKITGSAGDYEKFLAFAGSLPYAIGNPVYHWSHLELRRYFGISDVICEENAPEIWKKTNELLSEGTYTPQALIERSNVYVLCTTEDPADDLSYHQKLKENTAFKTMVLPAFRPDNAIAIDGPQWKAYLAQLSNASGVAVKDYASLKKALYACMDKFDELGCVASDHGLEYMPQAKLTEEEAARVFEQAYRGERLSQHETDGYKRSLLVWLAQEYHRRSWAMELHVGCLRGVNARMVRTVGAAAGYDTIGDAHVTIALGSFMNELEETGTLPQMILFSLNDNDNIPLAAMAGTFQDEITPSKIQLGTAWWFQDHRDGMEKQMHALADEGVLGRFIGMLTDSRSFLSYPRHEYFRRILCNLIGQYVQSGQYPQEEAMLKKLVQGICFYNAKQYFHL